MHLLPKFALLIVLVAVVHSDSTLAKKSYRGHKVYSVTPTSDQDCYFLLTLQKLGYDFWTNVEGPHIPVEVRVAPRKQKRFTLLIEARKMPYYVIIEDVGETIPDTSEELAA